jgi:hypothetical protein
VLGTVPAVSYMQFVCDMRHAWPAYAHTEQLIIMYPAVQHLEKNRACNLLTQCSHSSGHSPVESLHQAKESWEQLQGGE